LAGFAFSLGDDGTPTGTPIPLDFSSSFAAIFSHRSRSSLRGAKRPYTFATIAMSAWRLFGRFLEMLDVNHLGPSGIGRVREEHR
jgi:hypothetical protein